MSKPNNRPSHHPAPTPEPDVLGKRGKFPLVLHWSELRGAISESALAGLTPEDRTAINERGAVCPVCSGVTPCRDINPEEGADDLAMSGHHTFVDRHSVGGRWSCGASGATPVRTWRTVWTGPRPLRGSGTR